MHLDGSSAGPSHQTRARSGTEGGKGAATQEEARVLVGNLIGEDHVNYVLMYNMLTGIRIGVSFVLVFISASRRVVEDSIDF